MDFSFSKRLALSTVAAGLLVGGGWFWLKDASAAACPGTKTHGVSVNNGPTVLASTGGFINVLPGQATTLPDGRIRTALMVQDVASQGNVEGLGDLRISLDHSKPAPPSSLTSNQPGAPFPATQVVQFFPTFTLNGEDFKTQEPARVMNSNVGSFPPAPGTVYVLTNAMTLHSAEGNTMTLEPGKAFVIE